MRPVRRETIRAFGGKILGYAEFDNEGNEQVRDFYGRIVGTYDKSCDCTRDFYGKIVSQGNTVIGLLYK